MNPPVTQHKSSPQFVAQSLSLAAAGKIHHEIPYINQPPQLQSHSPLRPPVFPALETVVRPPDPSTGES